METGPGRTRADAQLGVDNPLSGKTAVPSSRPLVQATTRRATSRINGSPVRSTEPAGGPMLEGVGYEAAWLEARAAATELNAVLAALGLDGDDRGKAQAGWSDDGQVWCS
ncbi:hypothetical protein [Kitasatospora sp. NPDC059827]|uniref:hypothetical protein n=1 Tax=Kitasatospora sp. NPDC059827 TaxID=3346964 RepID=UPI00364DC99A